MIFDKVLDTLGKQIVKDMQEKVSQDLGSLKKSIVYNVEDSSISFNMLEYGVYVNDGTKPHWTSVRNLKGWSQRKGLNMYAVQRSIATYGTKAHPFMDEFENFGNKYMSILEDGTAEELEDFIYETLLKMNK